MKSLPQRKSPRLQGYDYGQSGAYFVTICTHQRAHIFGTIHEGDMLFSPAGNIALDCLIAVPNYYPMIELDAFIVMPNHIHAIIIVGTTPAVGTGLALSGAPDIPTTVSLSTVIGSYKSGVTRRIRAAIGEVAFVVWQGRYHDHIIRDEQALQTIRDYISNNPSRWDEDTFYTVS